MPRDLADVLHHFLPEAPPQPEAPEIAPLRGGVSPPAVLPLLALPIGDRDVVRAAFAWNLVVEIARLGGKTALIAPAGPASSTLWPEPGAGPLGAEIRLQDADGLGDLQRVAIDASVELAADAYSGGIVFVHVPPQWLIDARDGVGLLRWSLLLTSCDSRDLAESYGLAKLLLSANYESQVGVTIHGARELDEARVAFTRLATTTGRHLSKDLTSYGMLVDDLHVYRAIVSQRPIGLAHPQSRAARALRDVAGMLLESAQERALA